MSKLTEEIVGDLIRHGYAFMPIDINALKSAQSAARIFLLANTANRGDWWFKRKDNTELGIIEQISHQAGPMTQPSYALSFGHDLSRRRPNVEPHTRVCLGAITELYRDMRRRVSDLSLELQRHCGAQDVAGRIRSTFEMDDERVTTLLLRTSVCGQRGLKNDVMQAESVLSLYFGNEENEIWLKDEKRKRWMLRSPPYGSVLLFFGLKVGELDNPAFTSTQFRVDGHSTKPIRSTIMHVQMKELVADETAPDNVLPLMT